MFPEITTGVHYAERLIPELRRKYVCDVRSFWLALHGFYRLDGTNYVAGSVDPDTLRKRDTLLARELRELVDTWLASGHTKEGHEEYPYRRQLPIDLTERLNQFLRERPDGAGPYIFAHAGTSLLKDNELPELDDVDHPHRRIRQIALDRKREGEKMKNASALRIGIDVSFPLWQPEHWKQYATKEALRLFLTLFDARGLRFLLVQCGRCRRYDFIKTRKRYKRGWHCPPCDKIVARSASATARRKSWRKKCMSLVVEARPKYKPRPSFGELEVWLAEQVNNQLDPAETKIKRNWITYNLDEIEKRAKKAQMKNLRRMRAR